MAQAWARGGGLARIGPGPRVVVADLGPGPAPAGRDKVLCLPPDPTGRPAEQAAGQAAGKAVDQAAGQAAGQGAGSGVLG